MIREEEIYKIGILNKPHGIQGELLFTFTDDIFDRVDCDYLICLIDGIFVPFYIEEYRFRSDTTALVKLIDITTAEQARQFVNTEVWFPIKFAQETEEYEQRSWDYFVGFEIHDTHNGKLGKVKEVDTTTANTLFVINYNGEELLVPAQPDLIEAIDEKRREITMCIPEGLLDLDVE